ncbi:hypothetical protein LQG66_30955 [Bradyrhizobium ontarionense]|uniref:Uncharacterized protein n=1 Tax=Bradyrhizobium ontarionense TaxID=2898149 RepID=A0ABY3R8G7_9BRAD|nr:hypothetical protein [Bradyrhizobium sp. A19]UFZ03593.1 hypothetical protein LQG66_30955 [Bradyrhizobium sp. A19]
MTAELVALCLPQTPSLRGVQRRSNPDCLCGDILDCFAALAMTPRGILHRDNLRQRLRMNVIDLAARFASELCDLITLAKERVQGRPDLD